MMAPMHGLAKADFLEKTGRAPWKKLETPKQPRFPSLHRLLLEQRITYFELALTEKVLFSFKEVAEEVAFFVCHLILAARAGHLAVHIDSETSFLDPPLQLLWEGDAAAPLLQEKLQELSEQVFKGLRAAPSELIAEMGEDEAAIKPVCHLHNHYYLQKHWHLETRFLNALKAHLAFPPPSDIDERELTVYLKGLCEAGVLLEEQAQAVKQGCLSSLTLLTGGPGTGKTYTAAHLIAAFWRHLPNELKSSYQIELAAPTGKAAANLQKSLSRMLEKNGDMPILQAKTLHALLGIKQSGGVPSTSRLAADLVVVDESSMIDASLMADLLSALKPASRLVLLGDRHQLPAVGSGSLFADLAQAKREGQNIIPTVSLSRCLRTELTSIVSFAEAVNKGDAEEAMRFLRPSGPSGIRRLHFSQKSEEARRQLVYHYLSFVPTSLDEGQQATEWLEAYCKARLLTPLRLGPFGFDALNSLIYEEALRRAPKKGVLAIPIMIAANNYRQGLFNGETGLLIRRLQNGDVAKDEALFPPAQQGEEPRRFPALLLPKYSLAYCLSIHKSQGSEFDRAIIALPDGAERFGREVFYTAITRAKKNIDILASDEVLRKTIAGHGRRVSQVRERCCEWLRDLSV